MLSLKSPFLVSGNLILFQDDKNAACVYYVRRAPRISCDESGKPVFNLYAILPESGEVVSSDNILEAGMTLDVDLGVTKEDLAAAETDAQKYYGVKPKILSPAPLHDGKVRFAMAQAGDEEDPDKWFVTSEVTPSMLGDNRAALAIRATGRDARMLVAAAQSGAIAATVYYELNLIGITPAFHAKAVLDTNTVYRRLQDQKKDNLLFYTSEIDKVLEDLKNEKKLDFDIEKLDPELETQVMSSLMDDLRSQVIARFFEPAGVSSGSSGSPAGIVEQLGNAVTGLIRTLIPARHVLKSDVVISKNETFTIDLEQNSAKLKPVCPQAPLTEMIDNAGIDVSKRIVWVPTDDLPYINETISILIAADTFETSNIENMKVDCRVVDVDSGAIAMNPVSHPFSAKDEKLSWELNFNRKKGRNYGYEYKVTMYMKTASKILPEKLESDWKRSDVSSIYITPAEYYKDFSLDLVLNDLTVFSQAQMIQADVSLLYGSDDQVILFNQYFFKKADDCMSRKINLVVDRNLPLSYTIHLVYFLPGKEHEVEYRESGKRFFFIPNPFENLWSVELFCKADWDSIRRVFVDTRIHDVERKTPIDNHFTFSSEKSENRLDAAVSVDTPSRVFDYLVQFDSGEGAVQAGWYTHSDLPYLRIDTDKLKSERVYRFRIEDPAAWNKYDLEKLRVWYKFIDGSGREKSDKEDFKSPDRILQVRDCPWEEPFQYRLQFCYQNGDDHFVTGWEKADTDDIKIVLSNLNQ